VNIFFDVDYTLITWDVKLRPGVHEVFERLRADGHTIYLWSGVGPRWEIVKRFELHEHVTDCFWKPLYNHHARMEELGVTVIPDYVIDDHEEIIEAFTGTRIAEPRMPLDSDREMWRVYDDIAAFAAVSRQEVGSDGGGGA
jgi:FMN phosphatase YigB (HAD superfamily)